MSTLPTIRGRAKAKPLVCERNGRAFVALDGFQP
jgi:hypothetical protein